MIPKRTITNLLEDIQVEYDAVLKENARLKEENEKLNSEFAKDIKITELNNKISGLALENRHYGMPDFVWNKFEKIKEENNIPYWDKFIIEELAIATAYTVIYKDKEFTEYC